MATDIVADDLMRLHQAALDIYGDVELETVLQKVVDQARALVGARYGALAVLGPQLEIRSFVTSGITAEERARIGRPPVGKGLLGVPLHDGARLRLSCLQEDPRSVGFPPEHPPMRSLLAVPVVCRSNCRGNLYLTDREGGDGVFSADDEENLCRFATLASLAIDSAHVHERLAALAVAEERVRIAREMHDGVAQALAYFNAKAQAAQEFLKQGRVEEASTQLDQLADVARRTTHDVRESILALRTEISAERRLPAALADFVEHWEVQSRLRVEVEIDPGLDLSPAVELQALRIAQEALSNVRKHSGATRVQLRAVRDGNETLLEVADNGVGFDPAGPTRTGGGPRFGLAILRERAAAISARLTLESHPGSGTQVCLVIPANP